MYKLSIFALLFIFLLLPSNFALLVRGQVVHAESGQPISNVGLVQEQVENDDFLVAISNEQGFFEFSIEGNEIMIGIRNPTKTRKEILMPENIVLTKYIPLLNYSDYFISIRQIPPRNISFISQFVFPNTLTDRNYIDKNLVVKERATVNIEVKLWPLIEYNRCTAGVYDPQLARYVSPGFCKMVIFPQSGPAETTIHLTGEGFKSNQNYVIGTNSVSFKNITADSDGEIDVTFRLMEKFPQAIGCPPADKVCIVQIGIHNQFGPQLVYAFFNITQETSFGSWIYKNKEEVVESKRGSRTIELIAVDFNKQICIFEIESEEKVAVKVGEHEAKAGLGIVVYDIKRITEDGVQKDLCKIGAEITRETIFSRIVNWIRDLFV